MATAGILTEHGNKMSNFVKEEPAEKVLHVIPPDVEITGVKVESLVKVEHVTVPSILEAQKDADAELQKLFSKEEKTLAPHELVTPTLLKAADVAVEAAPSLAPESQSCTRQLDTLLMKAETFSSFISSCQDEVQAQFDKELEQEEECGQDENKPPTTPEEEGASPTPASSGKRRRSPRKNSARKARRRSTRGGSPQEKSDEATVQKAASKMSKSKAKAGAFRQPDIMVNGELKDYQLEGLRWLASLFENGLSGILADEMGLGKTIQVIAFLAYLRTKDVSGPFLIAAPLATLPNWVKEFHKWVPSMPCLLYHGSKAERETLRRTRMPPAGAKGANFPVIITSYEICMIDRTYLQNYTWKYMVIDEGQRVKNRNCRLIRELKELNTESRLLLSGTPIQNTLEELWTLLNFVNPTIFDDLSVFQSWFGFRNIGKDTQVSDIIDEEHKNRIVTKLHEILRPFLLRRLKQNVLVDMPPKKELVVYAPMSQLQRDFYALVQKGSLRDVLTTWGIEGAKGISQINDCMNLRKVCNHPFLFGEPKTNEGVYLGEANPETLVSACGKMVLLDKLCKKLKAGGHKVLLFSQMTGVLSIIEDYLRNRGWRYCRIDGSVNVFDRQEMIESFNSDPDVFIFLLSTRAGGLGINLAAADTCIIYDSDWNPHQDSQAQDRCHRIGQKKPVMVYRFLTGGSVEIEMMEKAISKKKLERMAIVGGDFHMAGRRRTSEAGMNIDRLQKLLEDDIDSLARMSKEENSAEMSETELNTILDRNLIFSEQCPQTGDMFDVVDSKDGGFLETMS